MPNGLGSYLSERVKPFYENHSIIPDMFKFENVSPHAVLKIVNGISAHKATGLDDISARLIRHGAEAIAPVCASTHFWRNPA